MNKGIALSVFIAAVFTAPLSAMAQSEQINLKLAHVANTDEPYHKAAEKFSDLVKKYTDGNVQVKIFPNSSLGSQKQILEGLLTGTVDISLTSAAALSNYLPKTQVIELPFMFRSREHVYKVMDGPLAKEIYAGDEQKKIKVIDTWENGFRNITNSVRPITKPEDMRGIKIRVMENKMYIEMFNALGATSVPMARGEVFTALQTKVVDAQENPMGQIYTSKFYEVQKYLTVTGHTYSPEVVVFSLATWNKIPGKYQEGIVKASNEAKQLNRTLSAQMDQEYIGKVKEKGMAVTVLSPEQIAPFQEKMSPVWKLYSDTIGQDLINRIKNTK